MKQRGLAIPIHPLFFALFPPLAFLAFNIREMYVGEILRPMAVSLVAGAVLLVAFRLLMGGWRKAALATSLVVLVLLAYGQFYTGLKAIGISGTVVRHRYFLPFLALVVGLTAYGIRRLRSVDALTQGANIMGLILLIGPVVGLVGYAIQERLASVDDSVACDLRLPEGEPPDVYLIILDAYQRSDIFRLNEYDNSPFLAALEQRGFYVADGSMSNYPHTKTSLASTLNMQYIQDFPEAFGSRPDNLWDVDHRIRHSAVRASLECLGYQTVAVETGYPWTELRDADIYLRVSSGAPTVLGSTAPLSAPDRVFLSTTILRALTDSQVALGKNLPAEALDPNDLRRHQVAGALGFLGRVADLPSPKFVFLHVASPHPPFIFGPNGEAVDPAEGKEADANAKTRYADQVAYLNPRVLQGIDSILARSDVPPIIVLMGDHGYTEGTGTKRQEQRMSILNAYLLPGDGARRLYPMITPVNSFRVIFDEYFGGGFGLAPDVSFYSASADNFRYKVVPNTWSPNSTQPADLP